MTIYLVRDSGTGTYTISAIYIVEGGAATGIANIYQVDSTASSGYTTLF